jgi:hypothetical protein
VLVLATIKTFLPPGVLKATLGSDFKLSDPMRTEPGRTYFEAWAIT